MEKRILLVGGGSGGHVYPLVAVAKSLQIKAQESGLNLKLAMLGEGVFAERAAKEAGIPLTKISAYKVRRYWSVKSILELFKIPVSFMQSLFFLFWFMPDAVFAKGGYVSVAPVIIARLFFIPVFIHESDSVPGMANTYLAKLAKRVFISFHNAESVLEGADIILVGNPVRKKLMVGDKNAARDYFNLHEERPTVLILGGSQGAQIINEAIASSLVMLSGKYNIIHQCGDTQYESVKASLDALLQEGTEQYAEPVKKYYRLYSFFEATELAMAYALADVIVARGGSGLIFEIAQIGKPAIIVPIADSAGNHQYLNAFEFSRNGARMIEEINLGRETLIREVDDILVADNYNIASTKIKSFAKPEAANLIASELLLS